MQQLFYFFTVLLMVFLMASCGTSNVINTLKPDADLAAPLVYEKEISNINIPISIKLKDIANQTNKSLDGLIYEDNQLEDDNIVLKVWKESPILINEESGKIRIVLPLKVWTKVRYGTQVLGMNISDTRELNFNGTVTLLSDVTLNNWQLQTKTTIKSIDWKENPSITIAGKVVPVTFLVNPAMNYFKPSIEKSIDDAIKKSLNFQPFVLDALDKISVPTLVNQQYETWFKIVPLSLNVTEAKIKNESILMDVGLESYMETFVGTKTQKTFQKEKITLKHAPKATDQFSASLMVVSPYLQISQIITKNFEGQEFVSGNKKVVVKKVDLWHKNGKMIIALDLLGSVNGTVYLTGIPMFDEQKSEIYFANLDYILDTKNALMKTANWLAQGIILKKIKENTKYSIKTDIQNAQKQMSTYLSNFSPASGVFINGKVDGITLDKIQLTNQAIVATVKTVGKINVTIDGLK
ncbi:MAG: DUF4403 family protein [Flavobacteriaceae bacterium]|nr:DUF4403 family protein [Flavobacteriaceae bacterium]